LTPEASTTLSILTYIVMILTLRLFIKKLLTKEVDSTTGAHTQNVERCGAK